MARRSRERDIESGMEPEKLPSVFTSEDGPVSGTIELPPVEGPSATFTAQMLESEEAIALRLEGAPIPSTPAGRMQQALLELFTAGDVEPPDPPVSDALLDMLLRMEAKCAGGGSCNLDDVRAALKIARGH